MKPRNFPWRKLWRQAGAKLRSGMPLTDAEARVVAHPRDIRMRMGAKGRS